AAGFSPPPCSSTSALRVFFFTDTAPAPLSTLSLHDALPISLHGELAAAGGDEEVDQTGREQGEHPERGGIGDRDEGIGEHDDEAGGRHHAEDAGVERELQEDLTDVGGGPLRQVDDLEGAAHEKHDECEER